MITIENFVKRKMKEVNFHGFVIEVGEKCKYLMINDYGTLIGCSHKPTPNFNDWDLNYKNSYYEVFGTVDFTGNWVESLTEV